MARRPVGRLTSRGAAEICTGLAVLVAAALILNLDRHLLFVVDDWDLLIGRHAWTVGNVLDPFNEHIVIGPALVYKLLTAVFGLESATPFYVVSVAAFCLSAVLLFVYARRRVGDWPAFLGAFLVLFLGAAYEDLLWAFQLGFFASVAAGIGMLIAFDREDDAGDRLACGLLVVSLLFSSVGVAFLAGAVAELALGRRPRGRRAYVALLPFSLYALWWIGWGHAAESHISLHNVEHLLGFVFDSAAAGFTSLFGLATGNGSEPDQPHLIWGRIALIVTAVLLIARLAWERRISRGLAVTLAIAVAFWVLTGLVRDMERFPTSSRYQYPSAVFILLIAAEGLRAVRIPRLAIAVALPLAGLAAIGGYSLMHRKYEDRWLPLANSLRASLGAVEIAGASADPSFLVRFAPSSAALARTYLDVVGQSGSPGFDEAELARQPERARERADQTLASALGLTLVPRWPGAETRRCQALRASRSGGAGVALPPGDYWLVNQGLGSVAVVLHRFAGRFAVDLGTVGPGGGASLTIPADESPRAWTLGLKGEGPGRLCRFGVVGPGP
jgi:hypothetical protein